MSRTRIELDLAKVQELAMRGNTDEEIARQLGVSRSTITRRKADSDAFDAAIRAGQQAAHSAVSNALYEQATRGNVAAITWYEKTRRGFHDTTDVTSKGEALGVISIEVIRPAGPPVDDEP